MDSAEERIFDPANLRQVAIVVKSVDEVLEYFHQALGIGPYPTVDVDFPTASYHGEIRGYRGKRAYFQWGPVQIELIETIDGKTIQEDFLREKGEGLHHLGFAVPDLKRAMELAQARGFQVTQHFIREDGSGFAFLDSDKTGGVVFELIQYSPAK